MKHMKNTRFYNREHQMILIKPVLIIFYLPVEYSF